LEEALQVRTWHTGKLYIYISDNTSFVVARYAGQVCYAADGFIENNSDALPVVLKEAR